MDLIFLAPPYETAAAYDETLQALVARAADSAPAVRKLSAAIPSPRGAGGGRACAQASAAGELSGAATGAGAGAGGRCAEFLSGSAAGERDG